MTTMERLGTTVKAVKVLGRAPCPTDGCKRQGRRVMLFDSMEVVELCVPCQRASDARLDAEERQERVDVMLRSAGVNPMLSEWTLDSFPRDEEGSASVAFVERWISDYRAGERLSVMLFGPQGSGKSGLAWAAIRALIERDLTPCRFASWNEALETMKDSFRHGYTTGEMRSLQAVPVLVLDDLGAEQPTAWARGELLRLVDHRMMHKRPTWYTSNFDPDALKLRLGHDDPIIGRRIVSRMIGNGSLQHRMNVSDRRMRAAA